MEPWDREVEERMLGITDIHEFDIEGYIMPVVVVANEAELQLQRAYRQQHGCWPPMDIR